METTTKTITWQVLTPADGHKLVNRKERIISERVESLNPQGWEEITDEEANALQAQWDYEREEEMRANQPAAPEEANNTDNAEA